MTGKLSYFYLRSCLNFAYSSSLNRFIACGSYTPVFTAIPIMHYSDDLGETWTSIACAFTSASQITAIARSDLLGLFVVGSTAFSSQPTTFWSTTGLTGSWTSASGTTGQIEKIIWVDELNMFISIGYAPSNIISPINYSTDGKNWTQTNYTTTSGYYVSDIVWSKLSRILVAVSPNLSNYLTSSNGITWTTGASNINIYSIGLNELLNNSNTVSVGNQAGYYNQRNNAIAIGYNSGQYTQGESSISIGYQAGFQNQGSASVAIGYQAGQTNQGISAVAIGDSAGLISQGFKGVAVGWGAGNNNQATGAVAVGNECADQFQGSFAVAVGTRAGSRTQGLNAVALGFQAGQTSQGASSIAIGSSAGQGNQLGDSIAIGTSAGQFAQQNTSIAIGYQAGQSGQRTNAIAIGNQAGQTGQGSGVGNPIAIGASAGQANQQENSLAIGSQAGRTNQGTNAISIGVLAGTASQAARAIAIGREAGQTNQGTGAIAIGYQAGPNSQAANSIVINASGSSLDNTTSNSTKINPIRDAPTASTYRMMLYDATTSEVVRSTAGTSAQNKTFIIDHPVDKNKFLVHACLEGPEAGVYYRGKGVITNNISVDIELPEYVDKLATDLTVQITPIYDNKVVKTYNVSEVNGNKFTVYGMNGSFFWNVIGKRNTIEVEPMKSEVILNGSGPYMYISEKM